LNTGKRQFMLLVSAVLKEVKQLGQAADEQATKGGEE
jgi:hypothetical protein